MRFVVPAFLILLLTLCAGAVQDDAAKKDLEALQGTWTAVAGERNGQKASEDDLKNFKVVFKGDKMIINPDNDNRTASFKLDPSNKPRALDITPEQGPKKGVSLPAIYELDGEALKICYDNEGVSDKRPTEFKTAPKSGLWLLVLKREKK
jgi:uncharacterized protein (TIGR03067 family)